MKKLWGGVMNEIDTFTKTTGFQALDVGAQVAFAFQATLILFFIVSPIMGFFLAQQIKNRTRLVIGVGIGMLIVLLGNVGLTLLLGKLLPAGTLPDWAIVLLSFAASGAVAMIVAKYILWVMADPGVPQWLTESEKRPYHELAPFEKRRREEMNRRKAARGGKK
jgi:hypothetical protein